MFQLDGVYCMLKLLSMTARSNPLGPMDLDTAMKPYRSYRWRLRGR